MMLGFRSPNANHVSYSISGNNSKGEGDEFVLENLNRKVKFYGLPSEERLTRICRNLYRFDEVQYFIITRGSDYTYTYDITEKNFIIQTNHTTPLLPIDVRKTKNMKNSVF